MERMLLGLQGWAGCRAWGQVGAGEGETPPSCRWDGGEENQPVQSIGETPCCRGLLQASKKAGILSSLINGGK